MIRNNIRDKLENYIIFTNKRIDLVYDKNRSQSVFVVY